MEKIIMIIGTRPNIIKAFSLYNTLKIYYDITLIHTGQHFDFNLSDIFFRELNFKKPDINFALTSKTKAGILEDYLYQNKDIFNLDINEILQRIFNTQLNNCGQLGEIIMKLENQINIIKPNLLIVFGDVTSTLASALCSYKLKIEIAHIEAGLRNYDYLMPEEVNRYLVDHLSTYRFCSEISGLNNLIKEKININNYLVGNTMLETLNYFKLQIEERETYLKYNLKKKEYILITIHRQENVDNIRVLENIMDQIIALSNKNKVIFPVHPRTRKNIININSLNKSNIILSEPLGYLDFLCLLNYSKFVITDSGGIQEESTELNIPCYTLRNNTERPSTLIENGGTNKLIKSIEDIDLNNYINENKNENINHTPSNKIKDILIKLI